MATSPSLFVVAPALGVRTLADFVALAKSKPGELTTPVTGFGSSQAVARESFTRLAGIYHFDFRIAYAMPPAIMLGVSLWLFKRRSG